MDFSDKLRMGGEDRTQIKTSECGSINSIIALNKSKQVDPWGSLDGQAGQTDELQVKMSDPASDESKIIITGNLTLTSTYMHTQGHLHTNT